MTKRQIVGHVLLNLAIGLLVCALGYTYYSGAGYQTNQTVLVGLWAGSAGVWVAFLGHVLISMFTKKDSALHDTNH